MRSVSHSIRSGRASRPRRWNNSSNKARDQFVIGRADCRQAAIASLERRSGSLTCQRGGGASRDDQQRPPFGLRGVPAWKICTSGTRSASSMIVPRRCGRRKCVRGATAPTCAGRSDRGHVVGQASHWSSIFAAIRFESVSRNASDLGSAGHSSGNRHLIHPVVALSEGEWPLAPQPPRAGCARSNPRRTPGSRVAPARGEAARDRRRR